MTYIQNPSSIEEKSFQIIQSMITEKDPDYVFHSEMEESIIKRAIHTTGDFDYLYTMRFEHDVLKKIEEVIRALSDRKYLPMWETIINKSTFDNMAAAIASPTVGASGAIYGILVAFAMFFPNAKLMLFFVPYPIAARYFIPIIVALDLFSGFTGFSLFGGNIAHFAHVGGALIGFLIMLYWKKHSFDKNRWDRFR